MPLCTAKAIAELELAKSFGPDIKVETYATGDEKEEFLCVVEVTAQDLDQQLHVATVLSKLLEKLSSEAFAPYGAKVPFTYRVKL